MKFIYNIALQLLTIPTCIDAFAPHRHHGMVASLKPKYNPKFEILQNEASICVRPDKTRIFVATNSEQVTDDTFHQNDLQEILAEGAEKIHHVIKNGYKDIPPLDPLNIGTISQEVEKMGADLTLTLNDAVVTGINTIHLESAPKVDLKELKVSVSFTFDYLELSTEDYDREGTFKILFKKRDVDILDRTLKVKMNDVHLNLTFDMEITETGPVLTFEDVKNIFTFGRVTTELSESDGITKLLQILTPILKKSAATLISKAIGGTVANLLTNKLQEICKEQEALVNKLAFIYKTKQRQGLLVDANGNELKPRILTGLGNVGELAYPMFWKIPRIEKEKLDTISISDIIATAKTGDILIFQGVAKGSMIIRRWTQSPISHVTMIVKEDNLMDGKPVLIQATSSEHFDLLRQDRVHGIQLNDIKDFLIEYKEEWIDPRPENPAAIAFRSLSREQRSDEDEISKAIVSFAKNTNGLPYAPELGMEPLYIAGLVEMDLEDKDGMEYYCASYIADALMHYGIITKEFVSQQYSPRDFTAMYNTLPFVSDTSSYGPELVVEFH